MQITDRVSTLPGAAPVPTGTTVTIKKVSDNSVVGTTTTDANGFFTYQINGSPGAVKWSATWSGQTREKYGNVAGQHGKWFEGEWDTFMRLFGDGAFTGIDGALAVTPGTGLQVVVATGVGLAAGIAFTAYTPTNLAILSNASGNPRVDRVVLRSTRTGVDAGKTELAVLTGTPAASPVAPAVTQNSTIWEVSLATFAVANGAGSIVSGNIADTRPFVTAPLATKAVQDIIGSSITTGPGVTGSYNSITGISSLQSAIKANQGSTTKVANTATFQFDSAKFTVAQDSTDVNKALVGLVGGGAVIPNIWQFGSATSVSSSSPGPRTITSQTSSVLANGLTYDWTVDLAAVLPNNVSSGHVDITVSVNGNARTWRAQTNGGVTSPHVVFGGNTGLAGAGAGVPVTATVTWIDGDSTAINGGQLRVTFSPRT